MNAVHETRNRTADDDAQPCDEQSRQGGARLVFDKNGVAVGILRQEADFQQA